MEWMSRVVWDGWMYERVSVKYCGGCAAVAVATAVAAAVVVEWLKGRAENELLRGAAAAAAARCAAWYGVASSEHLML